MPEEKTPNTEAIKKTVEESNRFVDWIVEVLRGKNWTTKFLLLDALLFIAFNPAAFRKILELFGAPYPESYPRYFWLVIGAIFVVAVVVAWRARPKGKLFRDPGERSAIKGLLPYGIADREVFKQLQRETEVTECYQAIADRDFRFGVLSGESGAGKTSFLQAGLRPSLLDDYCCVYVKFADIDPAAAIKQAILEWKIGVPENTPADAPLSSLLADVARADTKPLVLLLDQFEQFFVHFKRESKRRPFIRELNEWYRNGRGLPIKILICIRGDFLDHLSELQEIMGYSLGPQQKFRLKKFRPEQAAAVFRVIADAEKLDCDESFINELTEQELAGVDDGLISPVDIQILAWMITGQAGHEERAFNRPTFQKLGGVEGLLERFLTRALDARETPARRQAATKVLLALTDLDRNVRAGALTLDELSKKLGGALADSELKEAVKWLSRGDVRLITQVKRGEIEGYELAHERLIPALRRIAGKELSKADSASLLLDRRFNEWTGNNRDRRHRLNWRELRSIKKQTPFMQWEPNRSGKESLIAASWRQIRLYFILAFLPVFLAIIFTSVWRSQWGQLQLIKRDVAEFSEKPIEPRALSQIVRAYAIMGDFPKAFRVAEKLGFGSEKAYALRGIAEASAWNGEKDKGAQLLSQALLLAEKLGEDIDKASALRAIAEAYAKLGEKEKAAQLLSQALSLADKAGNWFLDSTTIIPVVEANIRLGEKEKAAQLLSKQAEGIVLTPPYFAQPIVEAYAKIGEKEKAAQLLSQALSQVLNNADPKNYDTQSRALWTIVEAYAWLESKGNDSQLLSQALSLAEVLNAGDPKNYVTQTITLQTIAKAHARLGEKEKAAQLLNQALSLAEEIQILPDKTYVLRTIAEVYTSLGEKGNDAQLLSQALFIAEKIGHQYFKANAIQSVAKAYARLGEKKKADQLLSQAYSLAEGIVDQFQKADILKHIAENYARIGNFRLARGSVRKIPIESDQAIAIASILEIWAISKNPRLAAEVSKEEEEAR